MPEKKTKSNKGTNALQKIIRAAKAYRREHPNAEWKSAMKHGAVEYRKTHKTKK